MIKLRHLLGGSFMLVMFLLQAQQREISGIISSDVDKKPIFGAKIQIKGTLIGTLSDENGKYQISVQKNTDTLIFSFDDLETQELPLGVSNTLNVLLKKQTQLETVVVTALGVKRSEKALGYAVSSVDENTIRNSNQNNVVNALNGVVAGANITQSSGAAGSGSSITLRGFTSLTGNNQALFVIDGVKINNSESPLGGEASDNTESVNFSNRGMDINPDDIENISVLKGGAATAIYGIDGANGVIIITTKKGKKSKDGKLNVSAGTAITLSQVNKLPELQNRYSQGDYNVYYPADSGVSTSWGPSIDQLSYDGASDYIYDKNGHIVLNTDPSAKSPVKAYDNVSDFFKTGITTKNNFSISGGTEVANFRLSAANLKENGVIPTNKFEKTNINLSSNLSFFEKKLNLSGSANYINSGGQRIQQGSNLSGIMLGLLRTPITFDNSAGYDKAWEHPESYSLSDGSQRNYRGGGGYDNPYWSVVKNPFTDDVNRFMGNTQFSYKFSKWATLGANLGLDTYSDKRKQVFAIGSRANPQGKVTNEILVVKQSDCYYTLSGSGAITKDRKLDLSYNIGFNTFNYSSDQLTSIGKSFAFDNFGNLAAATNINSFTYLNSYKSFSYFGSVDLGYKSMLYLTITARQDYDSRFIDPNNPNYKLKEIGFFYPSFSGSFVFSELIKNKKIIDFGKLRLSLAQVSKGPSSAYYTSTTYDQLSGSENITDGWSPSGGISFPYMGVTSFGLSNVQGNPNLRPEKTIDFEIGTNVTLFKKRVNIDFAYYHRKTVDAILPVSVSGTTGYSQILMNSGQLHTDGIDAVLGFTPIRKENFEWNVGTTFTKYVTIVDKLADGLDQLYVGGFTGSAIYHIPGQQYGQIYGGDYARTSDGKLIINDNPNDPDYGYPIADPNYKVIGNPNPKFIAGITNGFKIKNLDISFLLDMKVGNQMWNGTQGALTYFGMSKNTENRDEDKVFEGVKGHYDENGELVVSEATNDVTVKLNQDWYQANGGGFGNVSSPFVQNASAYRLRNFTIGYTFGLNKLKKPIVNELRVYLTGNNLLLFTPYTGVDPETSLTGSSSNAKGLDYFNMPNTRSVTFGINIKL